MITYTPLAAALRYIPKPLYSYSTEADFLSWMLDGYRELNLNSRYEGKVQIFEIHDNKIVLPQEIKEINMVTHMFKQPISADINSLTDCLCNPDLASSPEDTNAVCSYSLSYKLFLDSSYYNNNYTPLRYVGNSSSILCKNCPNKNTPCQQTFTVDSNRVLHTSLCEGFLCIDYDTEVTDEDGNILIPDIQALRQYLSYFAQARHWEERAAIKEQSAPQMFQDYLAKAEIYLRKVRGIDGLRRLDANSISGMQWDGYQKLIKIPEQYVYSR